MSFDADAHSFNRIKSAFDLFLFHHGTSICVSEAYWRRQCPPLTLKHKLLSPPCDFSYVWMKLPALQMPYLVIITIYCEKCAVATVLWKLCHGNCVVKTIL